MITCERCGKQIPDSTVICPACGTISSLAQSGPVTPTNYGQNPPSSLSYEYSQGYGQQSVYSSPPGYTQQSGYNQPYNAPSMYPPISVNINMQPVVTPAPSSSVNSGSLIVEILLNLFLGIYGVGWLMAGETSTGIILLICSLLLYWPIMIIGSIFTLCIGLVVLIPLAIGGVILNAILLNNLIKRKTAYVLVQPGQQGQPWPPQ